MIGGIKVKAYPIISIDIDRRIKMMLHWDVNNGISRRSWARNNGAVSAIKREMEREPLLKVTLPNIAASNDMASQQQITDELTTSFRDNGWADLSFETSAPGMVTIYHNGILQNNKLTEGQLVSALGTILKPDIVSKLKNFGFKQGTLVDGKSRKYPIEISRIYYDHLQAFFNKLSGGR